MYLGGSEIYIVQKKAEVKRMFLIGIINENNVIKNILSSTLSVMISCAERFKNNQRT